SVTDRFANISAIRVKEALASVARILDGLSAAVASMAGVALVAGIAVLAGAVLADRRRRIYDAVVLKVLGATRGNLLAGLALEYGFMGLATSLIALLLGSAAAYAFVHWVMEGDFGFLPGVAWAKRQRPCCATISGNYSPGRCSQAAIPASVRFTA